MSHCGVTGTDTASSHQRRRVKGIRAHGIGGEGNPDGRSTSAPPGPPSVGAQRMQSCLHGNRSLGPSQASPWVPAPQREEGREVGRGEWRRAGARGHLCVRHLLSVTSGGVAAAASLLPSILGWALLLPNRDPYRWRFWTTCSHFNREAPVICLPRTPDLCVLYTFKGPSGENALFFLPLGFIAIPTI